MSGHDDKQTNTTYYDNQIVLNISEYYDGKRDSNIFIVYDKEDELLYVYGARGKTSKYVRYQKTFDDIGVLYQFLSEIVAKNNVSISANYLTGLTNYDDYDSLNNRVNHNNEVVAYDNAQLSRRILEKYVTAFLF
jgi:hypothetical protein